MAADERYYGGENIRTQISVTFSRDLKTWTPARHILVPDELNRGQQPWNKGHFYDGMAAMKYDHQFLGFLSVHPRHAGDAGYIGLASSSDGLTWYQPLSCQPFIGPGADKDWDAGHTWLSNDPIQVGHWMYIYYVGSSRSWRTRYPASTRAIGLARVRRDRFVGQYGDVNGGWLLSREVKVTGNRLLINISPEHQAWNPEGVRYGHVQVELFDHTMGP